MSNQKTVAQSSGVGFFGILALIFIGLKLAEVGVVATWSWWWVLSPLWLPLAVGLGVVIIFYLVALVVRGR